jgi:hypothetical protein
VFDPLLDLLKDDTFDIDNDIFANV